MIYPNADGFQHKKDAESYSVKGKSRLRPLIDGVKEELLTLKIEVVWFMIPTAQSVS